ncbi:MAG: ATP-binding protein [Planctomycetota bacterium]|nr:ATP-binding protein [Planctomycetota bacterium]
MGDILGPEVEAACAGAFSRQCSTVMEISGNSPDRGRVPLRCRILPLPAPKSRTSALIVVIADMSAEKRAMEEAASRERLEAISGMAVAIAHEIRNPLASIKGAAQEVRRAAAAAMAGQADLLEVIMSESARLDGIVSDFLNFARMRPPVRRQVRVRDAMEEAEMLLKSRPEADGVEFRVECPPDLSAHADPDQLRQVLLNLGINALEAMALSPAGRRSLCISARAVADGTPRRASGDRENDPGGGLTGGKGAHRGKEPTRGRGGIVVEVTDTGPGMPEETRRRAFDPFFTTKPKGTGLGLAIVARIMRAHGGSVRLSGEPGRGTTAVLFFPGEPEARGGRGDEAVASATETGGSAG